MFPHLPPSLHSLKCGVGCLERARGRRAKEDCEFGPCARVTLNAPSGGNVPKLARKWQLNQRFGNAQGDRRFPPYKAGVCVSISHLLPFRILGRPPTESTGTGHANRPVRLTRQSTALARAVGCSVGRVGGASHCAVHGTQFLNVLLLSSRKGSQPHTAHPS